MAAAVLKSRERPREVPRASAVGDARQIGRARRTEEVISLCESMIDLSSAMFAVSSKEMRRPGRTSQNVYRVRAVAMYVAHVVLGLSMREIGVGFTRDRTTVLYACHSVEDERDDPAFDSQIAFVERIVAAAFPAHAEAAR